MRTPGGALRFVSIALMRRQGLRQIAILVWSIGLGALSFRSVQRPEAPSSALLTRARLTANSFGVDFKEFGSGCQPDWWIRV